jgi:hypothetical protein
MVGKIFFKLLSGLLTFLAGPTQTYRRTRGKSVWHSSSRCQHWPTENFEEIYRVPTVWRLPCMRQN